MTFLLLDPNWLIGKDLFLREKSFNFVKVAYPEKASNYASLSFVRK